MFGALLVGLLALPFLALIPATIAKGKGRSFFLWWLYGVLFWIIAFIHALLASPNSKALERRALRSGSMRKCTGCAELVRSDATICRYCRTDLVASRLAA